VAFAPARQRSIEARRHDEQLLAHRHAVPVEPVDELAVSLEPVELDPHRDRGVLSALPTRGRPDLLEHL
jgi:hypothetical protein